MTLNATFENGSALNASFGQDNAFDAALDSTVYIPVFENYEGPYAVTPSEQTQTLGTNNLHMTGDVTVNPIPSEYIIPSGTVDVPQNGEFDVSIYQKAYVLVRDGLKYASRQLW